MKCQALNQHAKRCGRKALYRQKYHGDSEIYSQTNIGWVIVFVCGHHLHDKANSENFCGFIKSDDLRDKQDFTVSRKGDRD